MRFLFVFLLFVPWSRAHAGEELRLVYWEEERPEIQEALDLLGERFEKTHANVDVRRNHYKTEDLRTHFQTAAIGGSGPELILAPHDFAGVFSISGIIQDVRSWAPLDAFDPMLVEAIKGPGSGVWGVPLNKGNHLILYVNKRLLPKPPATWEELTALAGKVGEGRYALAFNVLEPYWFVPFLGAFGEPEKGGRPLVGAKPTLNTKAMRDALAFVKSLGEKGVMPSSCDYSCAETLFLEDKAAVTINGDWALERYSKALGKDLAILPLLQMKSTGKWATPMYGGKYFFVNRRTKGKDLEAVKELIRFFVSKESQEWLAKKTSRLPSLKALLASDLVKKDPLLNASAEATAHAYPMPMRAEMRAVWDAIRPALQDAMAGRKTPAEAAKIMQISAERKIKSFSR